MGVLRQVLDAMLHENTHKPITGEFLSVGKQTINVKEDDIARLFNKYNVPAANLQQLASLENKDTQTQHRQDSISDEALYKSFCDAHYQCLDISDYEGATIIHDMNAPVPE